MRYCFSTKKKGETDLFTFKSQLFLIKKDRPVEEFMVAMGNSNGDKGSFLLLTSFSHCLYDLLVWSGKG